MRATTLLLSPPLLSLKPLTPTTSSQPFLYSPSPLAFPSLNLKPFFNPLTPLPNCPFIVRAEDGDADGAGPDDYDMDDEELEEVDNKKDFDIEYDPLAAASSSASGVSGAEEDIAIVQSKSFVSTRGWDSEMVVDYRINEDDFHKISLLDCDFFIRKPPDPDNDVYDFREVGHMCLSFILFYF